MNSPLVKAAATQFDGDAISGQRKAHETAAKKRWREEQRAVLAKLTRAELIDRIFEVEEFRESAERSEHEAGVRAHIALDKKQKIARELGAERQRYQAAREDLAKMASLLQSSAWRAVGDAVRGEQFADDEECPF